MQFMVPDPSVPGFDPYSVAMLGDPSFWKVWKTVAADESGMVANPGACSLEGYEFGGWFVFGDSVSIRYDFDLPYNDQPKTTVVNRIAAMMIPEDAPTSGDLRNGVWNDANAKDKVINAQIDHDAWWEIRGDTLYIHCKEGKVISDREQIETEYQLEGAWASRKWQIRKVVMDPWLQTDSMAFWFAHMPYVEDLSQAFIPDGCKDVNRMLQASGVVDLPSTMILPDSVKNAVAMFEACLYLRSLPKASPSST